MKPVHQAHDSDCMRACIASIFELELLRVPFFGEAAFASVRDRDRMTDDDRSRISLEFDGDLRKWLHEHGLDVEYLQEPGAAFAAGARSARLPWGWCVGEGKSPRGGWAHATVWDCREKPRLAHDPHPSGLGLDGPPTIFMCFNLVDPVKLVAGLGGAR